MGFGKGGTLFLYLMSRYPLICSKIITTVKYIFLFSSEDLDKFSKLKKKYSSLGHFSFSISL